MSDIDELVSSISGLTEQVGQLASAIDELVGSNTQMIDLMFQQIQQEAEERRSEPNGGPRYLDDPAPREDAEDA